MDIFTSAPHGDIVLLLFQLTILLLAARLLGELAQRFKQPSVVGEIMAGIILGPSILSSAFPLFGELIIPQTETSGYLLELMALTGAMFLLLITGMETDIKLIKRHAKTAISVSYGGIIVTFVTGFFLGMYLPDFLLADPENRLIFALFVGTAMSISAIPVIAKVLMDMNLIRRDIGQTIIASGMSDDTNGWILLSIVAGLASGAAVTFASVATIIGSVLAFLVFSFTLGRWFFKKVLNYVQDEIVSSHAILSLIIIFMFAWGAMTHALNLEAVLGAFIIGIIVGQMPRIPSHVHRTLETITLGIFAPIFFAVAGLKVNVLNLLTPTLLMIAFLVILIATVGKVVGTYIGARFIGGKDHWTSLSFGAGLNARGAMEIIIATIGLTLGVLSQEMFSIIVLMAMATSLMAPFALKWVLKRVKLDEQEKERLKKEEVASTSFIANANRVLLPVRVRKKPDAHTIQTVESVLLDKIAENTDLSVTLMTVVSENEKNRSQKYLNELASLFKQKELVVKVVVHHDPIAAIAEEVKKDYDLLVLGATERKPETDHLFNSLIDEMIRIAPCPTIVVHGKKMKKEWNPRRILIPTNGSIASKRAAEIAFYLSKSGEEDILILNVIEKSRFDHPELSGEREGRKHYHIGRQFVEEIKQLGESYSIRTHPMVKEGDRAENVIIDIAKENNVDLIIIGTGIRPGSSRLFLGPKVENLLINAPCPVLVFND